MVSYPQTLPLECVTTVTTIIKERKVAEKKVQFAHCLWNVQGFAQKALLGEAPDHASGFGAAKEAKPEQVQEMGDALADLRNESGMYGATGDENDAEGINIALLIQLVPVVLALLKQLGWIKKGAGE